MNDWIAANRSNKYVGAKMKRETEGVIGLYIRAARLRGTIKPTSTPVIVKIEWHEKSRKRDIDNIQSGTKFILDALQREGILINDSQRYVAQIYHQVFIDSEDYVEVYLEPVKTITKETVK